MKKHLPSETTDSRVNPFELRTAFGFHRFKAALADGSNSGAKADRGGAEGAEGGAEGAEGGAEGAEGGAEGVDRCRSSRNRLDRSAISSSIFSIHV